MQIKCSYTILFESVKSLHMWATASYKRHILSYTRQPSHHNPRIPFVTRFPAVPCSHVPIEARVRDYELFCMLCIVSIASDTIFLEEREMSVCWEGNFSCGAWQSTQRWMDPCGGTVGSLGFSGSLDPLCLALMKEALFFL